MRTQERVTAQIQRVVRVERRMVRRKVQRVEVVPVRLRLRALRDGEPELAEDAFDLLDDDGDRMLRAAPLASRRHRQVGRRRVGGARERYRGPALYVERLNARLRLVEALARRRLVRAGNGAELALTGAELRCGVAEVLDARGFERLGRGGGAEFTGGVALEGVDAVEKSLQAGHGRRCGIGAHG